MRSLLVGRTQRTRVGDCLSDPIELLSGVIQGSCIGPLLFVLYINSLTLLHDKAVTCKLYADDVKLYTDLTSNSGTEALQRSLDELADWARTWQLPISISKCSVLTLNVKQGSLEHEFYLDNCRLQQLREMKDLGITIDSQLKFNLHIDKIVGKAQSRASLIHRCFKTGSADILFRAFAVYVRPLLEYGSVVWSPHYKYAIEKVESVQRRFTKRLPGMSNIEYKQRLALLNETSLEHRRLIAEQVTLYKILFDLYDCNLKNELVLKTNVIPTRGNPFKLETSVSHSDVDKYRFINRTATIWNTLPPSIVQFTSLAVFKRTITNVNLSIFTVL